jgi:PKHD-type hydroxylase
MFVKEPFWYFDGVLGQRFLDELIRHGTEQKEILALTGKYKGRKGEELSKKESNDLKSKRHSNIVWLDDRWIYKEILPYIHRANENAGWNFNFDLSESCQFTKYKLNQYYDWHRDSWNEPYKKEMESKFNGKIRKLSVSVLLSDPNDYKGGDLEFAIMDKEPDKKADIIKLKKLKRGSVVVFPSFIWHRVKPVTKGTRYSLVIWSCGYPFR